MERVHSVSVDVAGQIRRTADAADDASLMRLQLQLEQRGLERGEHGEIAAAGTPIRMDPAAVSLFRELAGFSGGCFGDGTHWVRWIVKVMEWFRLRQGYGVTRARRARSYVR